MLADLGASRRRLVRGTESMVLGLAGLEAERKAVVLSSVRGLGGGDNGLRVTVSECLGKTRAEEV